MLECYRHAQFESIHTKHTYVAPLAVRVHRRKQRVDTIVRVGEDTVRVVAGSVAEADAEQACEEGGSYAHDDDDHRHRECCVQLEVEAEALAGDALDRKDGENVWYLPRVTTGGRVRSGCHVSPRAVG